MRKFMEILLNTIPVMFVLFGVMTMVFDNSISLKVITVALAIITGICTTIEFNKNTLTDIDNYTK